MSRTVRRRHMRRLVVGLLAVAALAPASAAAAEPSVHASCMGHEASAVSPPGTSEEFPGGMPQVRAVIGELFPGVPPGMAYRAFAQLHEGSHEACDEAFED
jgi:hypothetical protein